MSIPLYDKFSRATFPEDLTPLDRHLLGHYCLRFNPTLRPPRAFPGMPELVRITNAKERSILRSRARLIQQGYLYQITKGRPGRNSQFGVYEMSIERLIQVTGESPIIDDCPPGDELMTPEAEIGDWGVSNGSLVGHPKGKESNKSKESKTYDLERLKYILQGLPAHLRSLVTPGNNFEELLDELEFKGTIREAIRDHLSANSWSGVSKPGGIVDTLLRQLLASKLATGTQQLPSWCGSCDEVTRIVEKTWQLPGVNSGWTHSCPKCSRCAVTLGLIGQHSFD